MRKDGFTVERLKHKLQKHNGVYQISIEECEFVNHEGEKGIQVLVFGTEEYERDRISTTIERGVPDDFCLSYQYNGVYSFFRKSKDRGLIETS